MKYFKVFSIESLVGSAVAIIISSPNIAQRGCLYLLIIIFFIREYFNTVSLSFRHATTEKGGGREKAFTAARSSDSGQQ